MSALAGAGVLVEPESPPAHRRISLRRWQRCPRTAIPWTALSSGATRHALAVGDVDQVLQYVPVDGEEEVRAAFARVLPLQTGGGEAADVARQWFFETVVRVHRAGEHAAYTPGSSRPVWTSGR